MKLIDVLIFLIFNSILWSLINSVNELNSFVEENSKDLSKLSTDVPETSVATQNQKYKARLKPKIIKATKTLDNDEEKLRRKEYMKEYYQKNKTAIHEYRRNYQQNNKDILKQKRKSANKKISDRKYYQNNKEKKKESMKKYYLKKKNEKQIQQNIRSKFKDTQSGDDVGTSCNNEDVEKLKKKEYHKNYHQKNKEKIREDCQNWYINNKERKNEYSKNYYLKRKKEKELLNTKSDVKEDGSLVNDHSCECVNNNLNDSIIYSCEMPILKPVDGHLNQQAQKDLIDLSFLEDPDFLNNLNS
ncbi:unnamed protein product [Meloidogyne enterolobii]|uniref:Uncharacterized protein n=1 Tax=Meloidogyne enterolobii TaxID=390850 RepID=A0ACB0YF02_MELEN